MSRLQIDPAIQTVWATPTTLRFGIDRELASLDNPPPRIERLISALRTGLPRVHFDQVSSALGVNRAEREALLNTLEPILLPEIPDAQSAEDGRKPLNVHLSGDSQITSTLHGAITSAGHSLRRDPHVDLAVIVSHFVTPLKQARGWLTLGIPHLPVVFSESWVRLGPLVSAQGNPCLFCVGCHRVDAEPDWVAIASQCLGRRAASASASMMFATAALLSQMLNNWHTGRHDYSTTQFTLSSDTEVGFDVTSSEIFAHPRCTCHSLSGVP